jgi:capsular exopolysaccharide synthesis family protein
MFPFRRHKNPSEIHLAFQRTAEDWLRLPREAQSDTVVLQARQVRVTVDAEDYTQNDMENANPSVTVLPPQESGSEHRSRVAPHLVPLLTPAAFEAEPYRVLAHLVGQMHTEADLRILAISSPSSGDGKTSTAINLAGVLAQELEIRVLLIEAELRRPSIAQYLGIRHTTEGLVGMVLEPTLALEKVVHHCQPFNLDVLLAGHSLASPYDLLKLPRFGALLQETRKHYDYVIVDTPPLLPFADCRLIEKWIDGLLVVIAAHATPRKLLAAALDILDPEKLVGLVLNKDDHQTACYDYVYSYYTQFPSEHRKDGYPF